MRIVRAHASVQRHSAKVDSGLRSECAQIIDLEHFLRQTGFHLPENAYASVVIAVGRLKQGPERELATLF